LTFSVTLLYYCVIVKTDNVKFLNFKVETKSAVPVYKQVKQAIKRFIISGFLSSGDQLMSIREMASRQNIHPNTIVKVYSHLELEGFIFSRPGSGYFVAENLKNITEAKQELFYEAAWEYIQKARQLGHSSQEMAALVLILSQRSETDRTTAEKI